MGRRTRTFDLLNQSQVPYRSEMLGHNQVHFILDRCSHTLSTLPAEAMGRLHLILGRDAGGMTAALVSSELDGKDARIERRADVRRAIEDRPAKRGQS
jgi:hypothetical protein